MGSWRFRLDAPGLTPYHKAGLAGLAASLEKLRRLGELPAEWSLEITSQTLLLEGPSYDAKGLQDIQKRVYSIAPNGLVDFPLLEHWPPSKRAKWQSMLMQCFLQHPQSRRSAKEAVQASEPIDGNIVEYRYLPLLELKAHTGASVLDKWEKHASKKEPIEISTILLPGAMKRHNAVSETALTDSPEHFPLLLFSMLGCLYYDGVSFMKSGDFDPRTAMFLVVPRLRKLDAFVDNLIRYYDGFGKSQMTGLTVALGETDAALDAAIQLELHAVEQYELETELSVFRFGNVPWSQQRTRTGVYHTNRIPERVLVAYERFKNYFPNKGKGRMFPFRGQLADNLVAGQPWYRGFGAYMTDARRTRTRYWSKELNEAVNNQAIWDDTQKMQFVQWIQAGIRNRFGRVAAEAGERGSNVKAILNREYERMRLGFSRSRTKEQFRAEIMNFLAATKARTEGDATDSQLAIGLFRGEQDWREYRDLALLALASYRGKGSEVLQGDNDDEEGKE